MAPGTLAPERPADGSVNVSGEGDLLPEAPSSRRIGRNLQRAARYQPHRRPRCSVCRKIADYHGRRPGDSPVGSLADEQEKTSVCSWGCLATLFGLVDEDGGWRCYCGAPVSIPAADCRRCQASRTRRVEALEHILDKDLARGLSPT